MTTPASRPGHFSAACADLLSAVSRYFWRRRLPPWGPAVLAYASVVSASLAAAAALVTADLPTEALIAVI